MRESQDRMEKKFDAQDIRINEIELDVKELKTQRDDKSNKVAIAIAIMAVIVSAITIFIKQVYPDKVRQDKTPGQR